MTDFSNTNIHCSAIYNVMGGKSGKKTNLEWYNDYCSKHTDLRERFMAIPAEKVNLVSTINLKKRMDSSHEKMKEYELIKDDEQLSVGCMSHLKKVYCFEKYGKWSASADKGNKYVQKGTLGEEESIKLYSSVRGIGFSKNEERVKNKFLTGIPDLFLGKSIKEAQYIIDIKSSWDIETFTCNLGKDLNPAYWWQIQGYLAITGAKVGEVAYCLTNTPEYILNNEKMKLFSRMEAATEENKEFKAKYKELVNNMTFDDMPEQDRVIRFLVDRDNDAIEKIYNKVSKCREYLEEIEELHNQREFLAISAGEEE